MRVWRFGSNVDTDALAPGAYMQFGVDVLAKHCLKRLSPDFSRMVRPGDVIAAGPGFGVGSSREQAAAVLVHLGLAAVIAPSFGGLFFRNAFNLGLLALVCPEAEQIGSSAEGLEQGLKLAPESCYVEQAERRFEIEPTPDFLLAMVRAGGLVEVLREQKPWLK
jgi:3-isopropylmalate/(R)-2-methylmalate dehydratase small subunit